MGGREECQASDRSGDGTREGRHDAQRDTQVVDGSLRRAADIVGSELFTLVHKPEASGDASLDGAGVVCDSWMISSPPPRLYADTARPRRQITRDLARHTGRFPQLAHP